MIRIAFLGVGPTTLYTLHALLEQSPHPFRLSIYEAQPSAGRRAPYQPGWNDPAMLAKIASIEIPPVAESPCDWLRRQAPERLVDLVVDPVMIGERTFYLHRARRIFPRSVSTRSGDHKLAQDGPRGGRAAGRGHRRGAGRGGGSMKLCTNYIGGEMAGANIELHDMRFVAAPTIADTYDALRRQWWGTPGILHIDCWAEIEQPMATASS
ncbi:DUF1543 domain-containing protein [Sphingopyxis sp. JAI108]|uniref:DUF1543 domain-containing protein n=1 Tax=Sphingopyxis sp. JAI108 TaxID=2723060 RepID=UPI00183FB736|nr:DUF1543 domain-containing protein [Sphingopyxis sp. JAI108]NYF32587.1 hypothetical protein [Sphingopyxis sp. JAI108]